LNSPIFIDIGKGTQDFLLVKGKTFYKAVLPSPTLKLSEVVSSWNKKTLRIAGFTMGGGPVKKAVLDKVRSGCEVLMEPKSAKTIDDDIEMVRNYGIKIVEKLDEWDISFSDLDLEAIKNFLESCQVNEFEFLGVCCQDHGFEKGKSDRVKRFEILKERFAEDQDPFNFFFTDKTNVFSRFDSILEQINSLGLKGFVMDSKVAVICSLIIVAKEEGINSFACIDAGNGHTLCAVVEDGKVWGFFEHHTKFLNAKKMKYFLEKLCRAELSFEEVFEDGGHGAFSMKRVSPQKVYLVGPNREFFKELGEYAYPIGDSMLAGCSGLYEVYKRNFS